MVSLGLALVASALTGLAVTDLKAAQSEAAKIRAEYQLDGLQERAGLTVVTDPKAVRLRWSLPTLSGSAEVLAEAEGAKLGLTGTVSLDTATLTKLGVSDARDLHRRLQTLAADRAVGLALENADASPVWRACARSVVSIYGSAKAAPKMAYAAPTPGAVIARSGEVWRIRVTSGGWTDDRTVRFTGDPLHPAAVVERRLYRGNEMGDRCAALFAVG